MKKIKLFFGSSIDELSKERNELARFILGLNNRYVDKDIYIEAYFCEEESTKMKANGSQNRIDDYIENESDASFFMFFKKAGEYTLHELDLARNLLKKKKKPDVYIFFKTDGELPMNTKEIQKAVDRIANTYGHYYKPFRETDTIKMELLQYISEVLDFGQNVLIEEGKVYFDGVEMTEISLENIFAYQNNKEYRNLKKEITEIKVKIKEAAQNEDYKALVDHNRLREKKEKDFAELEKNIIIIIMKLQSEIKKSANPILINALRLAELGKIKEALKVLPSDKTIRATNEVFVSRVELMRDTVKKEAEKYISEAKARTDILKLDVNNSDRFNEISSIYESIWRTCEIAGDYDTLYDHICFLCEQNRTSECLKKATEFEKMICEKNDILSSYVLLKIADSYADLNKKQQAEEYYLKSIEIGERLANDNPERFEPVLGGSYNNAGNFYADQGNVKKAEEYYLKAIEIGERLATDNPEKFEPDLAASYNNAGVFYKNQGEVKKAEVYYLKAIEIRERLAKDNPERFESDLARSYNNAGNFYKDQGEVKKAEVYYLKAIEIGERLAKDNPERFEPDLATSYYNVSLFYDDEKSDKYEKLAYEIAKKLPENPYCRIIVSCQKK